MKNIFLVFLLQFYTVAKSQELNNLKYSEGYKVSELGTLSVHQSGSGDIPMLLIADAGFDHTFFNEFTGFNKKRYTFYTVVLPGKIVNGYPISGGSYTQLVWLNAIDSALESFVKERKLKNLVVAGHLTISTYVAMKFSIDHPEIVAATTIFAGQPYASWPSRKDPSGNTPVSLEERGGSIDYYMAPRFYKTLTKEHWNAGLYQPEHYAKNAQVGQTLFDETVATPMPVMIQLLCEYFTTDLSLEFDQISHPVLIAKPGFDSEYLASNPSHKKLFDEYWNKAELLDNYIVKTIPEARIALGKTHVKQLSREVNRFINKL